MAYRVNFFIQLLQSFLELATSFAGLGVIFSYTNTLGGWLYRVKSWHSVGIFFMVGGIIRVGVQPAMDQLIESVREGTLDFTLTKPKISAGHSIQRVEIWKVIDIVLGIAVLTIALIRLGHPTHVCWSSSRSRPCSVRRMIVYSFWLILASLSFWFVRVENMLVIFRVLYEAGRWPVNMYPGWLRFGLTFLVPVAFATTVPAQASTGKVDPAWFLGTVAMAALFFVTARFVWRACGTRRYSGASS